MSGAGVGYTIHETELQAAFQDAAATGADTLLHVSHVALDLGEA